MGTKWPLAAMALVFALLGGNAEAEGTVGRVDRNFGTGGKVLLPSSFEEVSDTVLLPDGRVIVAGRER